jgi:hypothetical protein
MWAMTWWWWVEKWLSLAQTSFCMEFSFICATKKTKKKEKEQKTLLYDRRVNGIRSTNPMALTGVYLFIHPYM